MPLSALHHSCLVACTGARRLKVEMEDNASASWESELMQGLLEAQLLLQLAPAEPNHYLAAAHFLEHAEFLNADAMAAALRLVLQGIQAAKQCKGEWASQQQVWPQPQQSPQHARRLGFNGNLQGPTVPHAVHAHMYMQWSPALRTCTACLGCRSSLL